MRCLLLSEQDAVCGGKGWGAAQGAVAAGFLAGEGSAACAIVGSLAGSAAGSFAGPAASIVGAGVGRIAENSCNKGYQGNTRYWPTPKGGQHRPDRQDKRLFNSAQ